MRHAMQASHAGLLHPTRLASIVASGHCHWTRLFDCPNTVCCLVSVSWNFCLKGRSLRPFDLPRMQSCALSLFSGIFLRQHVEGKVREMKVDCTCSFFWHNDIGCQATIEQNVECLQPLFVDITRGHLLIASSASLDVSTELSGTLEGSCSGRRRTYYPPVHGRKR